MKNLSTEDLLFFVEMMKKRNMALTAESLGLSMATASRRLAKLTDSFGEVLFVKNKNGMQPTTKAMEAERVVQHILEELQQLSSSIQFDPAFLKRNFVLAGVDNGVVAIMTPILPAIFKAAPGICLHMVETNRYVVEHQLRSGEVDFAIFPKSYPDGGNSLHSMTIYRHHCVYVTRKNHPLVQVDPLSQTFKEAISHYQRIEISTLYQESSRYDPYCPAPGKVLLTSPYFIGAAFGVLETDWVVAMPEKTAEYLAHWLPIHIHRVPVDDMPAIEPQLIWHDSTHHDPACQWFRSMVLSCCKQL